MSKFSITIFLSLFLVLIFANPVLAALQLEQDYPSLPKAISPEIQTITKNTTLPQLIKFYSTWAIIISILAVSVSLIVGGVLYITSAGKTAQTSKARSRISNGFLGLAILIGSFLILQIVNPSFNVLQIKKEQVATGIVFLSKGAYDGLASKELQQLIEEELAFYSPDYVYDSRDILGDLAQPFGDINSDPLKVFKVNFSKMSVYAIAFWGEEDDLKNFKLKTYSQPNLQGDVKEYDYRGQLDNNGNIIAGNTTVQKGANPVLHIIKIDTDDAIDSLDYVKPNFGFFKKTTGQDLDFIDQNGDARDNTQFFYPPLSWNKEGTGPGVYLANKDDEITYLSEGNTLQEVDTNTKVIIKGEPGKPGKQDPLYIFYEKETCKGAFRLFFLQRPIFFPKVFLSENYKSSKFNAEREDTILNFSSGSSGGFVWNLNYTESEYNPTTGGFLLAGGSTAQGVQVDQNMIGKAGNVVYNSTKSMQQQAGTQLIESDRYGYIDQAKCKTPKSFQIGNIHACREVKICNEPNFKGYCIAFTYDGKPLKQDYLTFYLPLPQFIPVNLPHYVEGKVRDLDGSWKEKTLNNVISKSDLQIGKNVKSIEIDGQCLVALFSDVLNFDAGMDCSVSGSNCRGTWPFSLLGGLGQYSEIFTSSVSDLSQGGHAISSCSGGSIGVTLKNLQSCAASIVVFPIQ